MRKILFLFAIFLTWYLAAMYRIDALMVLVVVEILIFLSMFFCVRYFKEKLENGFLTQNLILTRTQHIECPFWTENNGILPISRFRIRFSFSYDKEGKKKRMWFRGNVDRKKREIEKIKPEAPWSGTLFLFMEETVVNDYFAFYKAKMIHHNILQVSILPPDRDIKIHVEAQTTQNVPEEVQEELTQIGQTSDEFVQTREYVIGDSYRNIHWKQSARTDNLLVKEYQDEKKKHVILFLDFYQYETKNVEETSAFYEILWALISSLLEETSLYVSWTDSKEIKQDRQIGNHDEKRDLFLELYEKNWFKAKNNIYQEDNKTILRFGIDLKLYLLENELYCFTQEGYNQELEQIDITI